MVDKQQRLQPRVLGLARNVFVLGIVSFFTDFSTEMILPLLPAFLTSELGASIAFVGLVEGLAEASIHLFQIPAGLLSDRRNRRRPFIAIGYALSALTKPLLAIAGLPWHVLGLRVVDRVGKGVRDAPRDALIGESIGAAERGRSFGYHRTMDTLGAVLGGAAAIFFVQVLGIQTRTIFVIAGIGGALAVLIVLFFVRDVRAAGRTRATVAGALALPLQFWLFAGAVLLFSLGQFGAAFFVLRGQALGLPLGFLPIIFIIFNATHALLSTPLGVLSDRIGRTIPLATGWILFAVVAGVLGFAPNAGWLWAAVIGYGVFLALTDGIARATVADLVSADKRATAYAVLGLAIGVGVLVANLFVGWLLGAGSSLAFLYQGVTSLLAVGLLMAARR